MSSNLFLGTRSVARALIEVVKPRSDDFDLPIEDEILETLDNFINYFPIHMKYLFPVGLLLLQYGTWIFHGTIKTFTRLPLEERDRYVNGWVTSKISLRRDLVKGVKALCLTTFYSNPEVMAHVGYDIENHLAKVNGWGQPAEPASQEACQYFRKLGYDNNSGIPLPGLDGASKPVSQVTPKPSSMKKAAASKKTIIRKGAAKSASSRKKSANKKGGES